MTISYSVSEEDVDERDDTDDALLRDFCPNGARVFLLTES
jgi:hypothetical protein